MTAAKITGSMAYATVQSAIALAGIFYFAIIPIGTITDMTSDEMNIYGAIAWVISMGAFTIYNLTKEGA